MSDEPRPDPATRARSPRPAGVDLPSAGVTWTLARPGLAPDMEDLLNALHDHAELSQSVRVIDARTMAYFMLHANYRLEPEEAARIVAEADPDELAEAVYQAAIARPARRTYTAWARSALIAGGVRPDDVDRIPPDLVPFVLAHLEYAERVIPRKDFTEAGEASQAFAGFHRLADHGFGD